LPPFEGHSVRGVWRFKVIPGMGAACMDKMRERMEVFDKFGLITPGSGVWQAASRTEIRMEATWQNLHDYADWYDCDVVEARESGSEGSMSNWNFVVPGSPDFRLERRIL
jgi:hypothetical protein